MSEKISEAVSSSLVGWIVTATLGGIVTGVLWSLRMMLTNQREIALLKQHVEEDRQQRAALAARIDLLIDKLIK